MSSTLHDAARAELHVRRAVGHELEVSATAVLVAHAAAPELLRLDVDHLRERWGCGEHLRSNGRVGAEPVEVVPVPRVPRLEGPVRTPEFGVDERCFLPEGALDAERHDALGVGESELVGRLDGVFEVGGSCVRIAVGAGVCGTAVREQRSQVVVDVHAFPAHIACGPASRSEIVVPIRDADGGIVAVLDLDSDRPGTFDELDRAGLEMLVTDLAPRIDWVAAGARPGTLDISDV